MKLTNAEIFGAKAPLAELLRKDLPIKTSFALTKVAQKLDEHLTTIEKCREGLFKTYGTADPTNPDHLFVDPAGEKVEKFKAEMLELMNMEIEVVIQPVKLPDDLIINGITLIALEKFVTV